MKNGPEGPFLPAAPLTAIGFEIVANTPEEFAAVVKVEMAQWGKLIREKKIRAE